MLDIHILSARPTLFSSRAAAAAVAQPVLVRRLISSPGYTNRAKLTQWIDPAPGAGRQSRAPLTGGSTISHSSADGPVYSATNTQTTAEGEFHWRRADIIFIC